MFKSVNVLSLDRGQKLMSELTSYCQGKNISSAIIFGIVGSLESVRFAKETKKKFGVAYEEYPGPFSVLSGQGSLSVFEGQKIFHIHMSVGPIPTQVGGKIIGGHLVEANVWDTIEIYIGELDYQLCRDFDLKAGISVLRTT